MYIRIQLLYSLCFPRTCVSLHSSNYYLIKSKGQRMNQSIIHDNTCSPTHKKCGHKSQQSDIKKNLMTLNIIFSVVMLLSLQLHYITSSQWLKMMKKPRILVLDYPHAMSTSKCGQGFRGWLPSCMQGIAIHVALLSCVRSNSGGLTCVHGAQCDRRIMGGNAMDIRHMENTLNRKPFFSGWLSICPLDYNFLLITGDNSLNFLFCMYHSPLSNFL